MNKDVVSTAIQTNTRIIVDGINEIYRSGRQDQAEQNMPPYGIVRLISNILSIARDHGIHEIQNILEVGCGGGHMTKWLRAIAQDIVAFDASEEAIALAKATSDYPEVFCVGDGICPEKVTDRKFDLIVISEFHPFKRPILPGHTQLEYLEFYVDVLERYLRMLNKGGLIVVAHGINPCEHVEPAKLKLSTPVREFSPRKAAVEDLVPSKYVAKILNSFLVFLTRSRITCFYLSAKQ